MKQHSIAIIDLGGQYCHLISRRLRELGFSSSIYDYFVEPSQIAGHAGIILSGGPSSVNDDDPPRINPELLLLGCPVLGICYGHQLLAQERGATVTRGKSEFGASTIAAHTDNMLFEGTPSRQTVWMSHSDSVESVPSGFSVMASTAACETAAFGSDTLRVYGVQFHPEVDHSKYGARLLANFAQRVCGLTRREAGASRVETMLSEIRERADQDSVFFLVSGGVDSMVAFALCAKALGRDRVQGLYVNTGFMRKDETDELMANLEPLGLRDRVIVREEAETFFQALRVVSSPEQKRHIIGRLFVEIQSQAMRDLGIDEDGWLLGQGTIYPDTIESGGAKGRAAVIKTHHNRCAEIQHLIAKGRVIEPLADLYKDEVRDVGQELGFDTSLVRRWPFPGPGLAIRTLCVDTDSEGARGDPIALPKRFHEYRARSFPISSVGVQGDSRTYCRMVLVDGPLEYELLAQLSTWLCNENDGYNRVAYLVGACDEDFLARATVVAGSLSKQRVGRLQNADYLVRQIMAGCGLTDSVWQFPVVLLPLGARNGESIVLRPVDSVNGMTANFSRLSEPLLGQIWSELRSQSGIEAALLDITDKPPATIEWE